MRNKILAILAGVGLLFSCDASHNHRHHLHKQAVKVYHLHDGRYCYQDSNTLLWYWLILSNTNNTTYYTSTSNSLGEAKGYSWQPVVSESGGRLAPETSELEVANTIDQTLVVDERGFPEVDADGNLVDPDQLSPDDGYGSDTSTDSGGDTGSSDGGGDTGGGDGGGGGGDGGEA